jgi:hypothetical protein
LSDQGDTKLSEAAEQALDNRAPLDAIAEDLVAAPAAPKEKPRARKPRPEPKIEAQAADADGDDVEVEADTAPPRRVRDDSQDDDDLDQDDTDTDDDPFDFMDGLTTGSDDDEEGDKPTPQRADDDQPEDEDDDRKISVKVAGEIREVTLADLKRSYSAEGAIDKRIQEATEARNRAEETVREELAPVVQEVSDFHARLRHVYDNYNEMLFAPRVPPPDPSMRETDPLGYNLQWTDYQQDQQRLHEERSQMEQTLQQAAQIEANNRQQRLQAEAQALYSKLPGLKKPEAARKFKAEVTKVGRELGFSDEEIAGNSDHRVLLLAAKAAAYDNLKASLNGKRQTSAPTRKRPMPTEGSNRPKTPQSRKTSQRRKVMAKARETGNVDDVAMTLLL